MHRRAYLLHFYPSLRLDDFEVMPAYMEDALFEEIEKIQTLEILNQFDVSAYGMTDEKGRETLQTHYREKLKGIVPEKVIEDPRELVRILGGG